MLRLLPLLALLLTGCATHLGRPSAPPPAPVSTSFTVQRDIVYTPPGWPQAVKANLYLPTGPGPSPAVLLLHGGGWKSKDRRWHMDSIAEKLASRGYVVLNATYRGVPQWHYPAPVEDLREAIKFLRAHAAEYSLRPDRIATFGYSAGGHLAALVGLSDGPPETRVQAIVTGGVPADFSLHPDSILTRGFIGGTLAQKPKEYHEASPVNHVRSDSPPTFVYHGTWDWLVPPEHSRRLDAALTKAGVRHELYWMHGLEHFTGFIFEGGSEDAAIEFLDRELR